MVSTLTGAVTAKDVLTLIGTCVGAGIPLALAWFGLARLSVPSAAL
ncbi:MAG: hypothetical protein V8R21_06050 [Dysosmobacter sp.]